MELSKIFTNEKKAVFEKDGNKLKITYDPNFFCLKNSPSRIGRDISLAEFSAIVILGCVKSWDLKINGVLVPLTQEGLEEVRESFLEDLWRFLYTDSRVSIKE